MVRALVTGATGQDGSYLLDALCARGDEVLAVCRPGHRVTAGLREDDTRVEVAEIDMMRPHEVRAFARDVAADVVFHLAAVSSVAASWKDPESTGIVTGVAAGAIMYGALEAKPDARVVLASSGEIYAGSRRDSYDESSEIAPTNPYGAAKAYAHLTARMLREQGAHVSAAVLFNHESPRRGEGFVTRKITSGAARIARGEQESLVLGNLDARRDWGWAPDYVDAMLRAAAHDDPGEYVIATGQSHSVRDFAMAALKAAGLEGREDLISVDPSLLRSGDAPTLVGDPRHAQKVLGWCSTKTFDQIVDAMVRSDL